MKTNWMKRAVIVAGACVLALAFAAENPAPAPKAGEKTDTAGDGAWQEVMKALRPPPPPESWRTKEPGKEELAAWERKNGALAALAADKARDFYLKHPQHPKAPEARRREIELLGVAVQLGETNRQARFDELQEQRLKDPSVPAAEKFDLRAQRVLRLLNSGDGIVAAPTLDAAEKETRNLQRDFPDRDEVFELYLMLARAHLDGGNVSRSKALAQEVSTKGSDEAKEEGASLVRKLEMIGQTLELKFTDLNGKAIDLRDYAGKVVLVDFWATWCTPCRAALPEVREAFNKYQSRGFEILGISFDKDKEALKKFTGEEKMSWPQYFDGLGWENKFGTRFGIQGIPTMWLVDKKGRLRELSAGQGLAGKIEKLLAEN